MKCKVYTILHLVLLVKMKNIIPNKITKGRYLKKLDIAKKCLAIENNQLKCGHYSLLFSMHVDDDEQHFN